MNMKKIRITLKRSVIGRPKTQRATIEALGIKKLNGSVEKEATPQILGMVRSVSHLVEVEEIK
jgi:large subunit ribosomal protein L30